MNGNRACRANRFPRSAPLPGLLLALLCCGTTLPAQPRELDPAAIEAIDRFVTARMAAQSVPGLALAVTRGGRVLYVQGYGTAGNGRPVTPRSRFFIASVSKSFTALAVMQLVEAGKIDLDAPVQDYLPGFTLADPAAAAGITIRQLLNQTSGLSEPGFPDMVLPQPRTIAERVASLRTTRPAAVPGTEYHYFSPNYGVLARVVEVAGGAPFSEYLETRVFAPLEMGDTLSVVTSTEGEGTAGLVQGHLVVFGFPVPWPEADGYLGGSGGVISTAEDLARYLIAQTNGGRYGNRQLVTPASLRLMHTPPAGIGTDYAMGWTETVIAGRRALEHDGVISTYSADAVLLPEERIGIVLLYAASSLPTLALAAPRMRDGLVALLTGGEPEPGGLTVRMWGLITGLLALSGGLLAVRSLLRLPRWARRARSVPAWRLLPGIAWKLVPAAALAGLPALAAAFSDRVFGFVYLYESLPGIFVWLAITGALGAANGIARVAILSARRKAR